MRTLVIILLFIFAAALQAQDTLHPYFLPRIGSHIDAGDVEYFQLFPDLTGYKPDRYPSPFSWLPRMDRGRWWSAEAVVTAGPDDSIRFDCTQDNGERAVRKTISSNAAIVLGIYLENFEKIRTSQSPSSLQDADFLPDTLRAAVEELFDAKLLPSYWSESFQNDEPSVATVFQRHGQPLEGYVLALTEKQLLFWTAKPSFDPAAIDSALHVLSSDEIDTLIVRSSEHATGLFTGLFISVMSIGQSLIGSTSELYTTDPFVVMLSLTLPPMAAYIGSAIPVPHDYMLRWSTTESARFESSPIYESMMIRPGLPPEIRKRFPFIANAKLYHSPDDRIPITPVPNQALPAAPVYWSVGIEQLWLSVDGLIDLKPGLTVGHEHAVLRAPTRIADIGFRVQLSGGSVYVAADLRATARFGPLQLFAGYRGMWLPEELSVSTTRPSTGISRNPTTTTTTQHAENIKQFLYSELGIELVLWRMVFSLHTLTQLSPSASVHSITTDYIHGGKTYESRNDGMRLGGFILSMRYRF